MSSAIPILTLFLSGLAESHMIINKPESYNLNIPPLLQVDPLGPDFPFPCHNRYDFDRYTQV